jgi:hypothetical protein
MPLDINDDYKKIQDKLNSIKSYNDVKSQYSDAKKRAGETFDKSNSSVTGQLDKLSGNVDKNLDKSTNITNGVQSKIENYQKQLKNQLDHLLDISGIIGGSNSGGGKQSSSQIKYIKKLLLTTVKNVEPKIKKIVIDECIHALGCDRQQTYTPTTVYVKVKSIDVLNILKKDPTTKIGALSYEKSIDTNNLGTPYPMNRELYNRIQTAQPFNLDHGTNYIGHSGQDLFDITYTTQDDTGQTGDWFKVDIKPRTSNKVGEYVSDYYKTIKLVDTHNIMSSIMDSLCGAVSNKSSIGIGEVQDQTKADIILQRILGLCFENKKEIDVSGISKLSEVDGPLDDSFFEFTEIDLRNIDLKVQNVMNGVIEFIECDNVKLPVDTDSVINDLSNLIHVNDSDLVNACDSLTNTLTNNPNWPVGIQTNANIAVDFNFIKLIAQGIVGALISPKVLLPIYTMLKALGNTTVDLIDSFMSFLKHFKTFAKNVVSKIGALFVKELFLLIKKDILVLVQGVIVDLVKEKANKRLIMILKLIALLLIVAQFIKDWRECKSVIDEILGLLTLITSGSIPGFGGGNDVPLFLLFGSQLLDGYSETRAFIGTIEEMQKIGVPTGAMPSGAPNLELLSKLGQMKSMANEESENSKVQIAIPQLKMAPIGVTIPDIAYGKKM